MAKHRKKKRRLKMTKKAIAARRYRRKHRARKGWRSLGKKRFARLRGAARRAYLRKRSAVRRRHRKGMRRKHRNPFAFLSKRLGRAATYGGAASRQRAAQDAWNMRQHYAANPAGPR